MRVFFDTNVLVSAVISRGLCRDLLRMALEEHDVLVSQLVLDEFTHVLQNKFGASRAQVDDAMVLLENAEVTTNPGVILGAGDLDANDAAILAAAVEARADALVTGEKDLLEANDALPIPVVTPRQFWQMTRPTNEPDAYPDPTDGTDHTQISEPGDHRVKEKSYEFALSIIKLCRDLNEKREYVISRQLMRSGTSIGAQIEEAGAAESRKNFLHKMSIASKEARETNYWLRLLRDSEIDPGTDLDPYIDDSLDLIRLLTAIVKTTRRSLPNARRSGGRGQLKTKN